MTDEQKCLEWLKNRRDQTPMAGAKRMFGIAISALEKQEQTKEAIPHRNYQYLSDYWCECGWHLGKKGDVKFCADCGRRIKWD
jgi:hypothetical protein